MYARVRVAASTGQISQESPIAALSCDCWVKLFGTLILPWGCVLGATQTMSPNSHSRKVSVALYEKVQSERKVTICATRAVFRVSVSVFLWKSKER